MENVLTEEQKINMRRIGDTKLLVNLFLRNNMTDYELEKRTGIMAQKVGEILTNRELILEAFPEEGEAYYNEIVQRRMANPNLSVIPEKKEVPHIKLEAIFKEEKEQMLFLRHLMLTYRLKFKTLAELLQMEERKLIYNIYNANSYVVGSFSYLELYDNTDQEIAKKQVLKYIYNLLVAKSQKNEEQFNNFIKMISDSNAYDLKNRRTKGAAVTYQDMLTLLEYQLKYGLSSRIICQMFSLDYSHYLMKMQNMFQNNPLNLEKEQINTLHAKYELLTTYKLEKHYRYDKFARRF